MNCEQLELWRKYPEPKLFTRPLFAMYPLGEGIRIECEYCQTIWPVEKCKVDPVGSQWCCPKCVQKEAWKRKYCCGCGIRYYSRSQLFKHLRDHPDHLRD